MRMSHQQLRRQQPAEQPSSLGACNHYMTSGPDSIHTGVPVPDTRTFTLSIPTGCADLADMPLLHCLTVAWQRGVLGCRWRTLSSAKDPQC